MERVLGEKHLGSDLFLFLFFLGLVVEGGLRDNFRNDWFIIFERQIFQCFYLRIRAYLTIQGRKDLKGLQGILTLSTNYISKSRQGFSFLIFLILRHTLWCFIYHFSLGKVILIFLDDKFQQNLFRQFTVMILFLFSNERLISILNGMLVPFILK